MRATHCFLSLGIVLLSGLGGCDTASAPSKSAHDHGTADHGAVNGHVHSEARPVRVTYFSNKVELFMEYDPLVAGQEAVFLAHFTILETGEPIRLSSLSVRAAPSEGVPIVVENLRPIRDGIFDVRMKFPLAGDYDLQMTIAGLEVSDQFSPGRLKVWASASEARAAPAKASPPDAIAFLMEQQWKIGLRLAQVARRDLTTWLEVPGETRAPPTASAHVSSPKAGRLLAPPGGSLPQLGDRVQAGQILAQIQAPLLETAEVAERSFDLRDKAHGVEQEVSRAAAALEFARKEHERVSRLVRSGTASDREQSETQRDLAIAEADYAAAKSLQDWFEAALSSYPEMNPAGGNEATAAARMSSMIPLIAPVSGEVVAADVSLGEVVDALEPVFRIVAPDQLWVVAHVSEFDWHRLPDEAEAYFVPCGLPDQAIEIQASGSRLLHRGREVDPATRTLPLTYEIAGPPDQLRAGMLVDAHLRTGVAPLCACRVSPSCAMGEVRSSSPSSMASPLSGAKSTWGCVIVSGSRCSTG